MTKLYLIGSLKNTRIPVLANKLRKLGFNVFDDWYSAGPDADDYWRDHERAKGHDLPTALSGYAAQHVFNFDKQHLAESTIVVLVCPAGKSGHLELGWALGKGKYGFILLDADPDRYDVMYAFADGVYNSEEQLFDKLRSLKEKIG